MAGILQIKHGTKLRLALETAVGQETQFNLICTFNKMVNESAFLISIPMEGGKPLPLDENCKLLFQHEEAGIVQIFAGYADDELKEGIHKYWKVRLVAERRQMVQRADVRMKVSLPVQYMQDTWALNLDGEIDKENGETMDISKGGIAVYMNRCFEVGETCIFTLPRIGTASEGQPSREVVGIVCWTRPMPKGSAFRYVCGVRIRFESVLEEEQMQDYVASVKKRYRL